MSDERYFFIMSIGIGNMTVEFFSALIPLSVCNDYYESYCCDCYVSCLRTKKRNKSIFTTSISRRRLWRCQLRDLSPGGIWAGGPRSSLRWPHSPSSGPGWPSALPGRDHLEYCKDIDKDNYKDNVKDNDKDIHKGNDKHYDKDNDLLYWP